MWINWVNQIVYVFNIFYSSMARSLLRALVLKGDIKVVGEHHSKMSVWTTNVKKVVVDA